jgi:hypothetical protein
LATGKSTVASGSNSIATGRDTIASGSNSLTAGSGSKADAENSVAFGKGTIAKTDEQVVIGRYNTEDTSSLLVVGAGTSDASRKTIMKVDTAGARIDGTFIISGSSTFTNIGPAVFSGSIAQESNVATGTRAIALGYLTEASGQYSIATGYSTIASGLYSNAIGSNAVATGQTSFAGGISTIASGLGSVTFGGINEASGNYAFAIGSRNYAADNSSVAMGGFSRANGQYSIAAGVRVTSSANYQTVFGRDNLEIFEDSVFIIGNGTSNTNRSNIFVASGNTVQITGSLQVTAGITGSLLGTAATASYVLNAVSSSFAATASFVNRLNQNVIVTGSVNVSGSVTATSFTGSLRGHVFTSSINTEQYLLMASTGQAINWNNRNLLDSTSNISVSWGDRRLVNSSGFTTANWQSGILSDNSANTSVDWIGRDLKDTSGVTSVNYSNRALYNNAGGNILTFSTKNNLTGYGAISTVLNGDFLGATEDTQSINYYAGELYISDYAVPAVVYGELLYLDHSTAEWTYIDQTTNSCTRYLGIDLDGKDGVLTEGYILMTDNADPFHNSMPRIENPLIGMPVYIREGAEGSYNSYTCNIPSSGYVRVIGHVMYRAGRSGFETKYMIKFRPSNDWYEI